MGAKKITRTILNIQKNLSLKLHVRLTVDDNGQPKLFHNAYSYDGDDYINIESVPFMTLSLKTDEGWDKSNNIMITPMNIVHVVKAMDRLLKAIYSDDIFAVDRNNKIVIYKDMVEEHTERVFNLGANQRLIMTPAIILDHNDIEIEGVILYLNKPENSVQLSIDAFESLCYQIKTIDLFTYSQLLLNYYLIQRDMNLTEPIKRQHSPSRRQVFQTESSSFVQGNFKRSFDMFDGLGKK